MEPMTVTVTVAILLDCVRVLAYGAAIGLPLYAIVARICKANEE